MKSIEIRRVCRHNAVIAAITFREELGYDTYIYQGKREYWWFGSKREEHAQAVAVIDGEEVWLSCNGKYIFTSRKDSGFKPAFKETIDSFLRNVNAERGGDRKRKARTRKAE